MEINGKEVNGIWEIMQELMGKGLGHEWGMDINGRGVWMSLGPWKLMENGS